MLNRAQQRDGELAILRNEIMRSRFECDHLQLTNDELRVKADRMLGKAPSLSVASFVESESFVETTVVEAGTESSTKTAHGGGASGGGRSHRDFGTGVKLSEEEVRSIEFAIGDPIAAGVELADLKTDLRGINLEAEKTVRVCFSSLRVSVCEKMMGGLVPLAWEQTGVLLVYFFFSHHRIPSLSLSLSHPPFLPANQRVARERSAAANRAGGRRCKAAHGAPQTAPFRSPPGGSEEGEHDEKLRGCHEAQRREACDLHSQKERSTTRSTNDRRGAPYSGN